MLSLYDIYFFKPGGELLSVAIGCEDHICLLAPAERGAVLKIILYVRKGKHIKEYVIKYASSM